jgi:glycosyltransferase involved in cell wall biosynthesis
LHVVASVAPDDGGSATAILKTAGALSAIGHDALVLATTADGPDRQLNRDTTRSVTERGAQVLFCRRSRPRSLKNSWQQGLRTFCRAPSADVIHVHGVYLANSIWSYLASRLTRTPYLVQPHGTLEPYQEARNSRRKSAFNRLIGHRILRNASALIATSGAEAENLRRRRTKAPVVVVPLGTGIVAPRRPTTFRSPMWISLPRERRVTFLGRLATKKRLDLLMQAWSRLTCAGHLTVAGPQEDWTWEQLEDQLTPERRQSVTYMGNLDEAEVSWLLDQCGLLVLPSENENFGLVVTEAMIHGCAVLTTRQTAASEHVTAAEAGVVLDEVCVDQLVEQLSRLLDDSDTLTTMGKAAKEYAESELTWVSSANRLVECYLSAAPDTRR